MERLYDEGVLFFASEACLRGEAVEFRIRLSSVDRPNLVADLVTEVAIVLSRLWGHAPPVNGVRLAHTVTGRTSAVAVLEDAAAPRRALIMVETGVPFEYVMEAVDASGAVLCRLGHAACERYDNRFTHPGVRAHPRVTLAEARAWALIRKNTGR